MAVRDVEGESKVERRESVVEWASFSSAMTFSDDVPDRVSLRRALLKEDGTLQLGFRGDTLDQQLATLNVLIVSQPAAARFSRRLSSRSLGDAGRE